jgi:hypothetical protein
MVKPVRTHADVTAASCRYLSKCYVGKWFAEGDREVAALIKLTAPGHGALDQAASGSA